MSYVKHHYLQCIISCCNLIRQLTHIVNYDIVNIVQANYLLPKNRLSFVLTLMSKHLYVSKEQVNNITYDAY